MKSSLSIIAVALLLIGCVDKKNDQETIQPKPVTVSIYRAQSSSHTPTAYYNARIQAIESASLISRATGFLLKKNFADGALVEKGDVLFEIDPTTYEAALQVAIASLKEAESSLKLVELNHSRNKVLVTSGGISQANLDRSYAELQVAKSKVQAANSNVVIQKDNLENTKVKAPYSGQLGKTNFSIGDMVGPNFGPITDLVQITPIEASFFLKESELVKHQVRTRELSDFSMKVEGNVLDAAGKITFIDNKVNANSGTVNIAARFDNSNGALIPNQFVRVGISPSQPIDGVVVPHKSIHQDKENKYVLIIDEGIATRRDVDVLARLGQEVFITDGLSVGEPVIIGGLQRIRPGSLVTFKE